ncbi:hypothetical protein F4679DRAFT_434778 [Xylaria curta]|nr:hypothetical protein F4679DRAFT_434778 [Xylaria curta]
MMYSNETLPEVIHQDLKKVFPQKILPHTLLKHKHLKKGVALHELKMLQKIIQASDACTSTIEHEDVWNFSVHHPMLCLAFEDYGTKMQVKPVMSACMIVDVTDTAFEKVNFCILIKPASLERVEKIVEAQSANLQRTNQTNAVRQDMIAISCDTKADVAATTGEAQLAIWTKGGLNRACLLLKKPKGTSPGALPLPMLRVRNNEWYLLFAYYDNSERSFILSEQEIGSTRNLCNIYRLIRCLQLLANWVEDEFREYIDTVLVLGAMKSWVED